MCRKRNRKGEKHGKGLRHFSMKVCEKVQRKGTTSYNEVADELVAEFSAADNHILPNESVRVGTDQRVLGGEGQAAPPGLEVVFLEGPRCMVPVEEAQVAGKFASVSSQAYDQKNIRRRVYDALNVLMAMNIISKEKKEIKWIGLPTNSAQECQNLEVHPNLPFPHIMGAVPSQSREDLSGHPMTSVPDPGCFCSKWIEL